MKSVWSKSYDIKKRNHLKGDIEVEAVVIGAGITGLLTAYMLKERGVDVIVIDRGKILNGNTKNTTAKITIQHNIIYDKLIKEFGEDNAKKYAKANQLAIETYQEIIDSNNIDCDFEREDAYVYSLDKPEKIENEYEAAIKIGIDAELVDEIELPFKIAKAVKFKNQAQFNPVKFLNYIAKELVIYEDTKALDIKEDTVITNHGNIKAKSIVVATHFPIINTPGYYFMRMHQEREHLIALKDAQIIHGMYVDENEGGYTFRRYEDLLILGGISKRTGDNELGGSYDKLRDLANKLYPNSIEKYNWSAQDCMTSDGIPYIGIYSKEMPNVYVATGFNKWGMTSSMVSAIIISDMIVGVDHDFYDIFSPSRFDMSASIKNLVKDGFETTYNFIAQKIHIPMQTIEHVNNGEGEIVIYNGEKVGVYKDESGEVYTVSTKCPHLGCELKWNADDLSWDCPCHGSRFDYKGNLLDSPSIKELKYEE
ncbi:MULTISPECIES: FAD-dependent oxidoreductase [unclassified Clostridium]|uniref:FAD-dependent oxidoreductase n=1 Tax=unclassified Clostridium TaxID=2614128 RepID=UPI00189A627C|nr:MULTISPECIES: FAD-dependent oxidoreductase [unclassified Clostridium]MCR1952779.1 FAD-dependent oxidoreductase [Clostridium sp. DSM 100503]